MTNYSNSATVVNVVAGTNLTKYKPVFSHNSKYLFVLSGMVVKVYSTVSGECVRQLRGHKKEIVTCLVNPKNSLQLVTVSAGGQFKFWDYLDGICLKTIKIDCGVAKFFWPASKSPLFIVTKNSKVLELADFEQPKQKWKQIINQFSDPNHVAVGLNGYYVVAIVKKGLSVHVVPENKKMNHYTSSNLILTCIATHPTDYCFATGDKNGKIHLWYNFMNDRFVRNSLHWHQLPVADVCFTAAGSSFLSGGGESVLVTWKADTNTKSFVPRLGMPIVYVSVSPNNCYVATSHADNAIRILNNQRNVEHTIQGLTMSPHWEELDWTPVPTGIVYDPRSKAAVMNGRPGHLQFFKISEDKQLFNLDITSVNYHHSERNYKVFPIEVEKAAIDSKGNWLATVERRDDNKTSPDIRLKFWRYKPAISNFVLNTNVEMPHLGKVSCLKFRPVEGDDEDTFLLVTASEEDKRFKFWTLIDDSDIYKTRSCWNCECVGYYRDLPCRTVSFSHDGSVLGVACDNIVSLWSSKNCELQTTLSHAKIRDPVRHLEFGYKDCAKLLVCATENSMNVWDLITLTMKWYVSLPVTHLVKDYLSNTMAVFTKDSSLFVFEPSSPEPISVRKKVSNESILAASFIPNERTQESALTWQRKSTLYFMDKSMALLQLFETSEIDDTVPQNVHIHSETPMTPFGRLVAMQRTSGVIPEEEALPLDTVSSSELLYEMFSGPSHTLPPVSVLFDLYLDTCLFKKRTDKVVNEEDETDVFERRKKTLMAMEIDSDSDVEDNRKGAKEPKEATIAKGQKDKFELEKIDEMELSRKLDEVEKVSFDWLTFD